MVHSLFIIVHHDKLIEYGIATSTRSSAIKERIESLGLSENEHYLLQDILQQVPSGSKHKKVYMLTPEAFKLALMRARRYANQSIDVTKYAKYYLFLEQVVSYYMKYQLKLEQLASSKLVTRADIGNERLSDSMYALTKLGSLIEEDDGSKEIKRMVADGLITKKNIKDLKNIAKMGNVDTSEFDDKFPDSSSDEECKTDGEED